VSSPVASRQRLDGPHPVLCFLHGAQEAANGSNLDGVAGHQSPAWHADNFHITPDKAVAEHNGDEAKTFPTGFNYGGDAVFWFASYDRGDRFQKL
jgi:hypothetical protein